MITLFSFDIGIHLQLFAVARKELSCSWVRLASPCYMKLRMRCSRSVTLSTDLGRGLQAASTTLWVATCSLTHTSHVQDSLSMSSLMITFNKEEMFESKLFHFRFRQNLSLSL